METDFSEILNKLIEKIKNGREFDINDEIDAHSMAAAHYLPAKEFFLEGLDNSFASWRFECLMNLTHHYIDLEENYINKFRELILTDPDENVRSVAMGALDRNGERPDRALVIAMYTDSEYDNREDAFWVLLGLCKVPREKIPLALERVKKKELNLTLEGLKIILDENKIPMPEELLSIDPELLKSKRK